WRSSPAGRPACRRPPTGWTARSGPGPRGRWGRSRRRS
ncbi:MAG: hypothetical protein AVDCRST_MAG64-205, partial [uncultured Phycisphaerae bacterium]